MNPLSKLSPPQGAVKGKKRLGRGHGCHGGHTSSRGHKGQGARSGGKLRPRFEGGQMPLQRRLPKRGFFSFNRTKAAVLTLQQLNQFPAGSIVGPQEFYKAQLIHDLRSSIRLISSGELKVKLTVKVHHTSESARNKIEKLNGKVEVLSLAGR